MIPATRTLFQAECDPMQNKGGFPIRTDGLAIGLCCALLFVSCEDSPVGEKEPEQCRARAGDVIQPLSKGNYWQRAHERGVGSDTNRTLVDDTMQVEIDGNSYTASILKSTNPTTGSVEEESRLLWNGPKGLYTLGMIGPKDTLLIKPHLQYKYPVSAGETWQSLLMVYRDLEGEVEIADTLTTKASRTSEKLVTPLDTFDTVVYHNFARQSPHVSSYHHFFEYYSPGIGHVGEKLYSHPDSTLLYRNRNEDRNTNIDVITNLIDYCLH